MAAEKNDPNYADMNDPALLEACRDDGMAWAKAFCQIKAKQRWTTDDIDEGLMVGWFANAIENSTIVRRRHAGFATLPVIGKSLNDGNG